MRCPIILRVSSGRRQVFQLTFREIRMTRVGCDKSLSHQGWWNIKGNSWNGGASVFISWSCLTLIELKGSNSKRISRLYVWYLNLSQFVFIYLFFTFFLPSVTTSRRTGIPERQSNMFLRSDSVLVFPSCRWLQDVLSTCTSVHASETCFDNWKWAECMRTQFWYYVIRSQYKANRWWTDVCLVFFFYLLEPPSLHTDCRCCKC